MMIPLSAASLFSKKLLVQASDTGKSPFHKQLQPVLPLMSRSLILGQV